MNKHFLNWQRNGDKLQATLLDKIYTVEPLGRDWAIRDPNGSLLVGRYSSADSAISHFESMMRGSAMVRGSITDSERDEWLRTHNSNTGKPL